MRSLSKTRCTPKPDSIGPCHCPVVISPSDAANFSPNCFTTSLAGQRFKLVFEHERVAERCNVGFASGSTKLREHLRRIAAEIRAAPLRVEIHLAEGKPAIAAKRVGVFLQVRAQLLVGGLGVGGDVFGDELELLAQPPADDRVVLVEAEGDRFAGENFFANVVADQSFQFACTRWPPPGATEGRCERLDPPLGDENLSRFGGVARNEFEGSENQQRRAAESAAAAHGEIAGGTRVGCRVSRVEESECCCIALCLE